MGHFFNFEKNISRLHFINNYWNKANTCLHILSTFQLQLFQKSVFLAGTNFWSCQAPAVRPSSEASRAKRVLRAAKPRAAEPPLLYLTLLDFTLLDLTWLDLTLLYFTLLYFTLLDLTWLDLTWLYFTLLYFTLTY